MAEPLVIRFAADTSRAQSAMAALTAQIIGNMAATSVAMQGGAANANGFGGALGALAQNASKAAAAVGADVKNIASSTAAAATAERATLQSVVTAFTGAAVASNTASTTVKTGVATTSTAITTLAAQLPILAYLGAGLGVAGAAYLVVSAAVSQANAQLDKFVALGAESEKTGIGVGFLQRFKEAAEDAKIEVSEIDQALRHASQATAPKFEQQNGIQKQLQDIFASGYTGSFQSKGLSDYLGAKDAETRVRAVVTAMQELRDLGLQLGAIDLAEKVFGAATAERIRSGRLDIDAIAEALNRKRDDLVTQEQVDNATEFKDRLHDAYEEIDKALHVSVALAEAGNSVNRAWLGVVETVAKAAVEAGSFLDKMTAAVRIRVTSGQPPLYPRQVEEGEGSLAADLGAAAGRGARGKVLYDAPIGPEKLEPTVTPPPGGPPRRPLSFFIEDQVGTAPRARGGGRKAAESDPIETFTNQLEKSAAAAKAEAENFAKSNAEKQVAIQLAKAQEIASQNGTTLTEAQTAAITAAAEKTARYRDQLQDLEQQQRQGAETARYFGDALANGLADAAIEGKSFSSVLSGILKQVERSALQALFTGQGPLAGLLGTAPAASAGSNATGGLLGGVLGSALKGGGSAAGSPLPGAQGPSLPSAGIFDSLAGLFRANGGPVSAGQPVTVGEMGRELFVPNADGKVIPVAGGGSRSASMTDARSFSFDMRGSTLTEAQARAAFGQMLGAYDRGLSQNLHTRVDEARANFGGRG